MPSNITDAPAPTRLEQFQIERFAEQGFLSIGKTLTDGEIDFLRQEYGAVFEQAWKENKLRNLSIDDGTDSQAKKNAPEQIMQMCGRNIHFRRLLYDDRVLDIATDLIGSDIQLIHDQALFKPAHVGGPISWHQDNAYWKCRPTNLVSCWLTLDDVVRENGAMQLIPDSHLKPVWNEKSDSSNALHDLKDVDESKAVVVDLPAGGCVSSLSNPTLYPTQYDRPPTSGICHPFHAAQNLQ